MAQHDYVIANGTGSAVRSDLNDALAAIVSMNSGSTEPSTTFAFQFWADTNANLLKMRNSANDGWIELRQLDGEFTSVSVANGTAAAPSIFFNASGTDTGIYSNGTDSVDVSTGGTRRLDIGSAGDVTVRGGNVTLNAQGDLRLADSDSSNWVAFQAPATVASNVTWTLPSADGTSGQALSTNGSGTLSWSSVGGDKIEEGNTSAEVVDTGSDGHFKVTTEGTEALRVDSSQRVGIGTTSPQQLLHISSATPDIRLSDTDGGYVDIDAGGGNLNLRADQGDTQASSSINFFVDNTERARIDSSGRMGLGTTAPGNYDAAGDNLVIYGPSESGITLASGTSSGGNIYFADGTTGNELYRGWITYSHNIDAMRFGTSGTERVRITSDGSFQFNSGYGSVATAYGCRAWVNFTGNGTVTIKGDGNVTSITDHSTGIYSVNFTNNMPDANYAYTLGARDLDNGMGVPTLQADPTATPSTSALKLIYNYPTDQAYYDAADVCVAIFR